MNFYCTGKLRKELGIKDRDLTSPAIEEDDILDWFVDLIRVGHKKGLIFVHPKTRYALVSVDLKRKQIRNIGEVFKRTIGAVLSAEGVEFEVIAKVLNVLKGINIAKTNNANVLGSMSNMIKDLKWAIDSPDEFTASRNLDFSYRLSRTPILTLDCHFSYEPFSQILRDRYGAKAGFERTIEKELAELLGPNVNEFH